MEYNMEYVKCRDCGNTYAETESKCPKCGSFHKLIEVSCEPVAMIPTMKVEQVQGKNPHLPSKKKIRWEMIDKDTVQRGDGTTRVHWYRYRDRDNDLYEEKVTALETGEVIHECKEPLSKHTGHGSGKFKKE